MPTPKAPTQGDASLLERAATSHAFTTAKDMILVGGFNVYPRDVEEVLYQHPALLEAAVVGVPDARSGEKVKAFLVLKPGATATTEEIEAFCRERLTAYKVPKAYEFRAELPKTMIGKVLRRALLEEEKAKASG